MEWEGKRLRKEAWDSRKTAKWARGAISDMLKKQSPPRREGSEICWAAWSGMSIGWSLFERRCCRKILMASWWMLIAGDSNSGCIVRSRWCSLGWMHTRANRSCCCLLSGKIAWRRVGVDCALLVEKKVMNSSVPMGMPKTTIPSDLMGMDSWSRLSGMGIVDVCE